MAYAKQIRLVKKLAELTEHGAIAWKPSVSNNTFQVSFRDNTLRVGLKLSDLDEEIIEIQLLNGDGEIVESFNDEDLDQESGTSRTPSSWFKAMFELYNTARRTALGAEKVLDEIISDLDHIVPI